MYGLVCVRAARPRGGPCRRWVSAFIFCPTKKINFWWGLWGHLLGDTEKRHCLTSGDHGPPEDLCVQAAPYGPGMAGARGHTVLGSTRGGTDRGCLKEVQQACPRRAHL